MNNTTKDFQVSVLGIDLAKNSFQLHGVSTAGHRSIKKTLTRQKMRHCSKLTDFGAT
jgi:hypothetical protein